MTSPLYHGAVLCVSHTAADHGPTKHCRIDPVDGGRATYSRDNGANVFRTCMMACSYLWGPIDEEKTVQLYCMLNGVE